MPLDLVVTFIGSEGESELCPLRSNRDHPFQIGQTDVCEVMDMFSAERFDVKICV